MLSKPSPIQPVKIIDFFEKIKDGVYLHENICSLNLSSVITRVLQKATHCIKYNIGRGVRGDFLLSTGKSESDINGQYVSGIEPSLLFG